MRVERFVRKYKEEIFKVGFLATMILLTCTMNSMGIPVNFSLGDNGRENSRPRTTKNVNFVVVDNDGENSIPDTPTRHVSGVAERAIATISESVSKSDSEYRIRRAADDIYEIAKKNRENTSIVSEAIIGLEALIKKSASNYNRRYITDLIKSLCGV